VGQGRREVETFGANGMRQAYKNLPALAEEEKEAKYDIYSSSGNKEDSEYEKASKFEVTKGN